MVESWNRGVRLRRSRPPCNGVALWWWRHRRRLRRRCADEFEGSSLDRLGRSRCQGNSAAGQQRQVAEQTVDRLQVGVSGIFLLALNGRDGGPGNGLHFVNRAFAVVEEEGVGERIL